MNQQTVEAPVRPNQFPQPDFKREEILRAWKQPAPAKKSVAVKKVPAKASTKNPPPRDCLREVAFNLVAPSAKTVLLAGDFTDWERTPLKLQKLGRGAWQVKVSLPPGRVAYRFLVDGIWQNDPSRTELVPNPFGSHNNVMEVS